jgi:hypothetical protein
MCIYHALYLKNSNNKKKFFNLRFLKLELEKKNVIFNKSKHKISFKQESKWIN